MLLISYFSFLKIKVNKDSIDTVDFYCAIICFMCKSHIYKLRDFTNCKVFLYHLDVIIVQRVKI